MDELQEKPKEKWFFKTRAVVAAFLILGPLALPLLWFHPRYSLATKIFWTGVTILVTAFAWKATADALRTLNIYYDQIFGPGGPHEQGF